MTEINVTPLIDLAFALLIIFMITAPLLEQTIPIDLPVETAAPQPDREDRFQAVSVDSEGRFFFGEDEVTREQLQSLLGDLARDADPPVIRVRADASIAYQQVVTLIDIIKQENLSKISLDTRAQ